MATVNGSKVFDVVTVDPNFNLPPGVVDLGYTNPDDKTDPSLERSSDTGEVVVFEYDELGLGIDDTDLSAEGEANNLSNGLMPPDYVSVISQVMRQTSDGRYVVDIILDVEDIPGATNYEVGLTKA